MDTYSVRYERIAFFFSLYRIMPSQLTYSIRALNAEHTKFIYEFMAIEYTRHTHTHISRAKHSSDKCHSECWIEENRFSSDCISINSPFWMNCPHLHNTVLPNCGHWQPSSPPTTTTTAVSVEGKSINRSQLHTEGKTGFYAKSTHPQHSRTQIQYDISM